VAPRLSQPRLSLAQFEITHGMPAAVPADLEPVITHGTRDPHAWLLLGQAQQELGHQFEAANCFREALKLDPKLAEANRGLGVIEMGFDHYGPAVTFLERAYTEGDHSAVNRLAFASALLMRGDAGDSGRAEALLAEGPLPQSPSERFTQGLRLRARGRFADAADMFRAIPATDQTHERATFLLADCLRALGRNREAAAAMETYHRLVQTRQKLGYLTRQAQQAPPTPALLRDLGKTLLESGRPAEAAEQFRAWSRIAPGDPEARRWLSTAEKAQAEKAQAEKAQANDVRGSATRAQ
jgi:Flp pilus assembly protein TadD